MSSETGPSVMISFGVKGTVKWFDVSKRFGFINCDFGEIFVHSKNVSLNPRSLTPGKMVIFNIRSAPKGPEATNVTLSVDVGRSNSDNRGATAVRVPVTQREQTLITWHRTELSGWTKPLDKAKKSEEKQFGFDTDRFEGEVPDELTCTICWGVFNDPVQTPCEHLFCRQCIALWLVRKIHCPIDRKRLMPYNLEKAPRYMLTLLGKLKVHCKEAGRGCEAIVNLDNLAKHEKSCPFKTDDECQSKSQPDLVHAQPTDSDDPLIELADFSPFSGSEDGSVEDWLFDDWDIDTTGDDFGDYDSNYENNYRTNFRTTISRHFNM